MVTFFLKLISTPVFEDYYLNMMKQMDKELTGGSFDFSNKNTPETILAEESDIRSRASLVQDVIDRLIDKKFGREYLDDLRRLNYIYRIEYKFINGQRVCASSKVDPEAKDGSVIGEITLGENSSLAYESISKPTLLEECDVQQRADLVQQVIDRVLDKTFGKEYLNNLLKLHERFPIGYEIKDGVRTYKMDTQEAEKKSVETENIQQEESLVELTTLIKNSDNAPQPAGNIVEHVNKVEKKKRVLAGDAVAGNLKAYLGTKKKIKYLSVYQPEVLRKMYIFYKNKDRSAKARCESRKHEQELSLASTKPFIFNSAALKYSQFLEFIKSHQLKQGPGYKKEWKAAQLLKSEEK